MQDFNGQSYMIFSSNNNAHYIQTYLFSLQTHNVFEINIDFLQYSSNGLPKRLKWAKKIHVYLTTTFVTTSRNKEPQQGSECHSCNLSPVEHYTMYIKIYLVFVPRRWKHRKKIQNSIHLWWYWPNPMILNFRPRVINFRI